MPNSRTRERLETQAIVIGYAMSRLDRDYLTERGHLHWNDAFNEASGALSKPSDTFKNLRDEFDPVHDNPRQGWRNRQMRPSRQRVLDELRSVSNDALLELVRRILHGDDEAIDPAIDALAMVNHVASNVAERLLTGRRAEEYFLANSQSLISVSTDYLLDYRLSACGFDFGVRDQPAWAIEVKGLKNRSGDIQFTEREWIEAGLRKDNYWVVILGNLIGEPIPWIVRDPHSMLNAYSRYRRQLVVDWHASVSLPNL
jgi:hypothetical protein